MEVRTHIVDVLRRTVWFCEDSWFDRTRKVRTYGNVSLAAAGIAGPDHRDSEIYWPSPPRQVRGALKMAPVRDFTGYTFVDLGSGKGRTLFVAAEFPFQRIVGVELSGTLHTQACENIDTFRNPDGRVVESVRENAAEFQFPQGPLVVYMFNPFGAATMERVLDRLGESLRRSPRHAVLILHSSRCGEQVKCIPEMRPSHAGRYLQIFSNGEAVAAAL